MFKFRVLFSSAFVTYFIFMSDSELSLSSPPPPPPPLHPPFPNLLSSNSMDCAKEARPVNGTAESLLDLVQFRVPVFVPYLFSLVPSNLLLCAFMKTSPSVNDHQHSAHVVFPKYSLLSYCVPEFACETFKDLSVIHGSIFV